MASQKMQYEVILEVGFIFFIAVLSLSSTDNKTNLTSYTDDIRNQSYLFANSTLYIKSYGDESFQLPENLGRVCKFNKRSPTDDSTYHTEITCNIVGENVFNFWEFRSFTREINENVLFSLTVKCERGGNILFPYPGRAKLLYKIHIINCFMLEYHSEMRDSSVDNIPDDMKYFTLSDSTIVVKYNDLLDSLNPTHLTEAFECGPLNAVEITERNMTSLFVNLTSAESSEKKDVDQNTDIYKNHLWVERKCNYKYLKILDRSHSVWLDHHRLICQLEKSVCPEIQIMNYSSSGIRKIPVQFYDWRLIYKNLKYVDLSSNEISELGPITCHGKEEDKINIGTLDLRYNNITSLRVRNVRLMARNICDGLFVDIRNNPFDCDCEMKDFVDLLKERNFTQKVKYQYLFTLKCFTPISLRGKLLHQMSLQQLGCEILKTTFLKLPIIILCVAVIFSTACVLIGLRYRKEIIILAYTRLHIVLPCQKIKKLEIKKYDAFIAYSEADIHWVIYILAKNLENPKCGRRFSLCLHHRDFVVGAAISDNIVKSVERSRHTIIVISKNFLKSEWCLLEFRTALHQSLLEKKRHLIIVLLEDIPTKEFEPELKRCMQTLTYVKVDDRWFWDKLVYALSDRSKSLEQRDKTERFVDSTCEVPLSRKKKQITD